MANAQILVVVRGLSEVPAEAFVAAVESAVRAAGGLGLGPWTYDASPVTVTSMPHSAGGGGDEVVTAGPWSGLETVVSSALAAGTHRVVYSSFRQNVSGFSDTGDDPRFAAIAEAVRRMLAPRGAVLRSSFRTLRNPISWDRGVPRTIELTETGRTAGIGWGVLAALGVVAIALVGAKSSDRPKAAAKSRTSRGRRGRR